jgi:hypothetical protein
MFRCRPEDCTLVFSQKIADKEGAPEGDHDFRCGGRVGHENGNGEKKLFHPDLRVPDERP